MIRSTYAAVVLLAVPTVIAAQPIADAARAQAELLAQAIDTDRDGAIALDEMSMFGDTVFALIDADGDDRIIRDELAAFRFGMTEIASFRHRQQAYETAQSIMFDIFDRDSDGIISREEHDTGFERAHAFADIDGDAELTTDEYLSGFIFNIAMRNAMSAR